jgi:hypothetical protein
MMAEREGSYVLEGGRVVYTSGSVVMPARAEPASKAAAAMKDFILGEESWARAVRTDGGGVFYGGSSR